MQTTSLVLFCCATILLIYSIPGIESKPAESDEKYTTRFDSIDLDAILANRRLLKVYMDCVLERGTCNREGKVLKANLPDALQTGCSKCSEKQKEGSEKTIRHLIRKEKPLFEELKAKYDPTGEYSKKYEKELAEAEKAPE